jgi:hypothetical protein
MLEAGNNRESRLAQDTGLVVQAIMCYGRYCTRFNIAPSHEALLKNFLGWGYPGWGW